MLERLRLVRVRVPRLHRSTASLVWVDCETTGLSPRNDHMLQVAALVTDNDLNPLHNDGFQETIYQPPQVLAQMDSWCTAQHTGSGLVAAAQNSTHTVEQTEMRLLEYVQQYVTSPKKGLLCGYSVHFDRAFLEVHMPRFAAYLSHRSIDVSCISELARRWRPDVRIARQGQSAHLAMQDIRASLSDLRHYRKTWLR